MLDGAFRITSLGKLWRAEARTARTTNGLEAWTFFRFNCRVHLCSMLGYTDWGCPSHLLMMSVGRSLPRFEMIRVKGFSRQFIIYMQMYLSIAMELILCHRGCCRYDFHLRLLHKKKKFQRDLRHGRPNPVGHLSTSTRRE
jgi:hypothetical protein